LRVPREIYSENKSFVIGSRSLFYSTKKIDQYVGQAKLKPDVISLVHPRELNEINRLSLKSIYANGKTILLA